MGSGMSPISSRKRVPPWASRKAPRRLAVAPLKAPRTWPKSSLSSRSGGMAAQLTATKGAPRRLPCSWMARATSSLPVPVSPVTSTVASLSTRRPMVFCTWRRASLLPTRVWLSCVAVGALAGPRWAVMPASTRISSSRPMGLVRWSKAPRRMASMVLPALAKAVSTVTAGGSGRARMRASTSRPSSPGMRRSSSTASTLSCARSRKPASPPSACSTR